MNLSDAFLNKLFAADDDTGVASLEKSAEDTFAAGLLSEGALQTGADAGDEEEFDFSNVSDEDLIKMAQEVLLDDGSSSDEGEGNEDVSDEDLEKLSADAMGGKIMAHAFTNEIELMKVAMANGLCRVCKESQMDVEGASICSSCQSEFAES